MERKCPAASCLVCGSTLWICDPDDCDDPWHADGVEMADGWGWSCSEACLDEAVAAGLRGGKGGPIRAPDDLTDFVPPPGWRGTLTGCALTFGPLLVALLILVVAWLAFGAAGGEG